MLYRFVYPTGRHLPDAAVDATSVSYALIADQVGSLRLVVRALDGAVVQRMRHDAWGRIEEDFVAPGVEPMPFGFAGRLADRSTGLVHFGARDYDPGVGAWVEPDPIGFLGGLNGFEYAKGRPTTEWDPSGLRPGDEDSTPIDAAWDALLEINPLSIRENAEYGGVIARLPNGAYSYTPPVTLRMAGKVDVYEGFQLEAYASCGVVPVGDYHTHGRARPLDRKADEELSGGDLTGGTKTAADTGRASGQIRTGGPPIGYWMFLAPPRGSFGTHHVSTGGSFSTTMPAPIYVPGPF